MIKQVILIVCFISSVFLGYGQEPRLQRPGQLSEDLGFALYIVGDEEGYFSLKINDVTIFNDVHFVPEQLSEDPSIKEYICSDEAMISTVYYYVPTINSYVLESEFGRNRYNRIQKVYQEPLFGELFHLKMLRIVLTMNDKDYLFKARVNRKRGKALHINISTKPPQFIQSEIYGIF